MLSPDSAAVSTFKLSDLRSGPASVCGSYSVFSLALASGACDPREEEEAYDPIEIRLIRRPERATRGRKKKRMIQLRLVSFGYALR